MKKVFLACLIALLPQIISAQEVYTMGYSKATITVVDPSFFSTLEFPGQEPVCGFYDKDANNFYSTDYRTFRYVDEDMVKEESDDCAMEIDFDPNRYYGALTLPVVIDTVEWDNLIIRATGDKVRLVIKTDEKEIDNLYEDFYKKFKPGKVYLILQLKTFDTPKEDYITFCKLTENTPKPQRTFTKIPRW